MTFLCRENLDLRKMHTSHPSTARPGTRVFISLIPFLILSLAAAGHGGNLPLLGCPSLTDVGKTRACAPLATRVDCHPDKDASEEACLQRGCDWCVAEDGAPEATPWCYTKEDHGYRMVGSELETPIGYRVELTKGTNASYFGGDFENIIADFEFWDDAHLRMKIYPKDPPTPRFEVPIKLHVPPPTNRPENPLYEIRFSNSPTFSFQVVRKTSQSILFDTSLGGLTFAEQFIQITTKLPSRNVFGIGENEQHTFRHGFDKYEHFALWARDQVPDGNTNLYGVQPYYTVVEPSGDAHSVMMLNSNAMDVVMTPAPGLTYRTIGGLLDFHVFLGPTVENTVEQFTKTVGRAHIPPYWGLGFQLCRWGYNNIANMEAAVNRTAAYGIPHDVQYGDIDVMERALDFTIDAVNFNGLREYVQQLKGKGIKFITILDPGISVREPPGTYRPFDLGNELDVWIKRPDGSPTLGAVWPGPTYFPDYSRNATRTWWMTLIKEFKALIDFDGLWIDMNEPASWGVGDSEQGCDMSNPLNNPPYLPGVRNGNLADMTLCPDVRQEFGLHYNTHSLYGWSESEPTLAGVREALGTRGVVLTRSQFLGVGQWAAHWLGDNFSRWSNLHYSIIGMLQYNHFGVPYVGADICGFNENATAELCQRWQQLGAFYTFARNHNGINNQEQDPGVFGSAVAASSRDALLVRYTLLPYLYTLFYVHATRGSTVARALWHEFPSDEVSLGIDRQFLWGSGLLVTPVLDEGQTSVTAYFPDARWFDYFTGAELSTRGGYATLDAPLKVINVHLRGGLIFPTQEPGINTEASRKNPYGLIIALDDAGDAAGHLYLDDGDSIHPEVTLNYFELSFTAASNSCTGTVDHNGFSVAESNISSVRLLGAGAVKRVDVNGDNHADFLSSTTGEVTISNLSIQLDQGFQIQWHYEEGKR